GVISGNRVSRSSVLIIHFVPDLILVSARGAGRLLARFRYKVRVLPVRPGAVILPHWICRQLEPENFVLLTRKFQNEETLRSSEIKFYVTRAHPWVLRRIGMPVTWHRIAIRVELGLNVCQTFDGLTSRRFYFEFQQRRRPIDVQNMRLTGIPNSKPGHRNDTKRHTNGYHPDKKPKSSCATPIKRQKDKAWRDDTRHNQRDCSGKIPGLPFKR